MNGVMLLAWRHARHHQVQTITLLLCISVVIFLPLVTQTLMVRYQADLTKRAEGTPLIAGARGNRFDLTLAALYFRQSELEPVTMADYEDVRSTGFGVAIPLHVRFTARGRPIVATGIDYFELRNLRAESGSLPAFVGEAVLGADAAVALKLGPGDVLFSDQKDLYDISRPPALKMHVTGVLEPSGTADDTAVFVETGTAWLLEGIAHGHADARRVGEEGGIDPSLIIGEAEDFVAISQAMIEYNEVRPENLDSFHVHADPERLPLTAIIVVPHDTKAGTLLKARINTAGRFQMVVPADVIDDLLSFVFRIKSLLDTLFAILAASTALMIALVVLLSIRIRRPETNTLNRIGCSRYTVAALFATELLIIMALSLMLALVATGITLVTIPGLERLL